MLINSNCPQSAENRRSIDENIVTAGQSTKNSNPGKRLNLDFVYSDRFRFWFAYFCLYRSTQFILSRRQLIDFFRVYFHAAILRNQRSKIEASATVQRQGKCFR